MFQASESLAMGCVECQGIRMGPSKGKTASSDKVSLSLLSRNRELGWEADGPLGSPWEVVILLLLTFSFLGSGLNQGISDPAPAG